MTDFERDFFYYLNEEAGLYDDEPEPDTCSGCGEHIDDGDHRECQRRAWR